MSQGKTNGHSWLDVGFFVVAIILLIPLFWEFWHAIQRAIVMNQWPP